MAHVSNQAQLAAALCRQEPSIQITADFPLTSQLNILYDVVIESLAPYSLHTLFKDPGYDGFLFRIFGGGALRLANVTLDGRSEDHDPVSVLARSLICVTDGSLCLDTQSVLKNNRSYSDGGGVRIGGGTCCTNRFEMNGSARITGPIGYRGRGDAHHHGDLVQPEPMAAIGKPQREPHRPPFLWIEL